MLEIVLQEIDVNSFIVFFCYYTAKIKATALAFRMQAAFSFATHILFLGFFEGNYFNRNS